MEKLNNYNINWKLQLDDIMDNFCDYVNKNLKKRNTCVVNFARCVYEYIEKNPEDNIVFDLNDEFGFTIGDIISQFKICALSLLEKYDFIRYIPQTDLQYLIVKVS